MLFLENNTNSSNSNTMETKDLEKSKDETDFVKPQLQQQCPTNNNSNNKLNQNLTNSDTINSKRGTLFGDCEPKPACVVKTSLSTLEKLQIFNFPSRKKSDPNPPAKEKPKFVKSASIARLFGNNYSTKKSTSESIQLISNKVQPERFQKSSQGEQIQQLMPVAATVDTSAEFQIKDFNESPDRDISVKAIKSLSRGLGRLLRRHTHSVDISEPDPEFKVAYLGNVLTGWAKGEGYVEKPLATLWRNYTQNSKPDVVMKVRVCSSGLKATTKQHGLTEYWSHRITYCSAPKNYPRVFCWVYRHEGRKLKHEMRCHAVLCSKDSIAKDIGKKLQENITRALREFKRDKISRQNARLSLVNSVYDNPTMPRRKILLSVGGNNYRPPLERSKSAPKLGAIEEAIGEEDEDEENNASAEKKPELKSCCKEDDLYPAMTLGRRRCRRGHSIRRSNFIRRNSMKRQIANSQTTKENEETEKEDEVSEDLLNKNESRFSSGCSSLESPSIEEDYSDLLINNNYDASEPLLEGEIMSYFDMKLKPKPTSLVNLHQPLSQDSSCSSTENCLFNEKIRNTRSLDDLDNYLNTDDDDDENDDDILREHNENITFFNQEDILEILRSHDCGNVVSYAGHNLKHFTKKNLNETENLNDFNQNYENKFNLTPGAATECDDDDTKILDSQPESILCVDSDEGSISSGCETSSTVTTTNDDTKLLLDAQCNKNVSNQSSSKSPMVVQLEPIGEKIIKKKVEFHRSTKFISCNAKGQFSVADNINEHLLTQHDSDSEISDESGYVEEQENRNRIGKMKPGIV